MSKIISKSAQQTKKIGERLAKNCFGGCIIGLVGDLGGGKTTFTQGIAKGLGISQQITSPTFVLLKKYKVKSTKYKDELLRFYHIDLYRINVPSDVYSFGFDEALKDEGSIVVIEWVEKVIDILPEEKLIIKFDFISENERRIVFKPFGKKYEELVDKVN